MAPGIIGLDLGSGSVRVVTLKRGLWGVEGGVCRSLELQNGSTSDEILREALASLSVSGSLKGETVVVSIPGEEVMSRVITLPFEDPKKIAQVVAYEVEGLLPLNVEELVIDHQILDQGEGRSRVLVTAVPKKTVGEYLEWLHQVGIDPKAIEMGSMALYNVASFFNEFRERGILLVDVGRRRSSLCAMRKGLLRMCRTLLFGEEVLERALASEMALGAQGIKRGIREVGLLGGGVASEDPVLAVRAQGHGASERNVRTPIYNEEQRRLSAILRVTTDSLVKELRTTLQVIEMEGGEPLSDLFVCGEGSQIPGLPQHLAQSLGLSLLSVQEISQPAANRSLDLKRKGNLLDFLPREEKGLYIPALGLVLKEVLGREGSCINFRRGEFIYGKGARAARRRFYTLGVVGLLILCMGLLDLYLHYYFKEARYQAFRSDLRQAFVGMFPETKTIVDEVQQANTALGEMKKRLARLGSGEVTPLKILAELTSRIPKEAQIEVQELIIDHEKVRIEAEASSFDSIDKIKMALEGFENIKEVDISDARVGADQNRVKFRINLIWREGL